MIQARNKYVFIIRDNVDEEVGGLLIPGQGQEKPHTGDILTVGDLVEDQKIKDDKRCLFHKGTGFDIEYEGQTYLVIEGERIIAAI